MARSDRAQILIWSVLAVAVVLVGARWVSNGADGDERQGALVRTSGGAGVEIEPGGAGVLVHVAGAVVRPGVYRLPGEARVVDAIERAGGASSDAVRDAINLAARLTDGQQVVVPSKRAAAAPAGGGEADGPISLGTATAEQLESIDGIGPVTASKIIAHRDERGGIASIEELGEVHGIGPATLETLSGALQP